MAGKDKTNRNKRRIEKGGMPLQNLVNDEERIGISSIEIIPEIIQILTNCEARIGIDSLRICPV